MKLGPVRVMEAGVGLKPCVEEVCYKIYYMEGNFVKQISCMDYTSQLCLNIK